MSSWCIFQLRGVWRGGFGSGLGDGWRGFVMLLGVMFLGLSCGVHASPMPPMFYLKRVVLADYVVRGELGADNTIRVIETLAGKPPPGLKSIRVHEMYLRLQREFTKRDGPFEVVAFCPRTDEPGDWRGTLVFLHGDQVWADYIGRLHSTLYNRASFLAALQEEWTVKEERLRLLALPRSVERTRKLLEFALAHYGPVGSKSGYYNFYDPLTNEIVEGLLNPTAEERAVVFDVLRQAKTPDARDVLYDIAGHVGLPAEAFDPMVRIVEGESDAKLRSKAHQAMRRTDLARSSEYAYSHLAYDRADIGDLVVTFSWSQNDLRAVRALLKVAKEVDAYPPGPKTAAFRQALVLGTYYQSHPSLVYFVGKWGMADQSPTFEGLQRLASRFRPLDQGTITRDELARWWPAAEPVLARDYDLQSPAGREVWFRAWSGADPLTRAMLMRQWTFEATIDETWLLDAARENDAARRVLADLWARKRLSPAAKRTIIDRFLQVRFEEAEEKNYEGNLLRVIRAVARTEFPFPREAWVTYHTSMTDGRFKPQLHGDFSGLRSMENFDGTLLDQVSSPVGTPMTPRAIVELREEEYLDGQPNVFWRKTWELGPQTPPKPER